MSLTLFNVLFLTSSLSHSLTHFEPNLLPSNSDGYCNVSSIDTKNQYTNCINTVGCGWCHNNKTGTKSCEFVGICFYNSDSNFNSCEVLDHSISCNFIRLIGFFIIIGVIASTMSCCLSILRHCMINSNCESLVYFVGMMSVLFYSLIPVFLIYYSTFSIFCIVIVLAISVSFDILS